MRVAQAGGLPGATLFGELAMAEPLTRHQHQQSCPSERGLTQPPLQMHCARGACERLCPQVSAGHSAGDDAARRETRSDSSASAELRTTGDNAVGDPGTENTKSQ